MRMKQFDQRFSVPPYWYIKFTQFNVDIAMAVPFEESQLLTLLSKHFSSAKNDEKLYLTTKSIQRIAKVSNNEIVILGVASVNFTNNCLVTLKASNYKLEGIATPTYRDYRHFIYQIIGALISVVAGALMMLDKQILSRKDVWSLAPVALIGWGLMIVIFNLLVVAVDVFHIRRIALKRVLADIGTAVGLVGI